MNRVLLQDVSVTYPGSLRYLSIGTISCHHYYCSQKTSCLSPKMASNSSNTWLFDFTDVLVNKKYMCTHKIGSGGFGVVYHAVDYIASLSTSTPPEFAIKIMAKWDPNSENMPDPGTPLVESTLRKQQKWEMSTHNIVSDHPNIVTLHESFEDYRFIYMVMDYCSGPDLFGLATEFSFWRDDTRCKTMFLQILDAVEACHNLGVYHRDIKPENVLSSKDGKHYYLADFGLAISSPPANLKPSCGTFSYMSPGKRIIILRPPGN